MEAMTSSTLSQPISQRGWFDVLDDWVKRDRFIFVIVVVKWRMRVGVVKKEKTWYYFDDVVNLMLLYWKKRKRKWRVNNLDTLPWRIVVVS